MKFVIISIILLELYIISGVSLNQEELSSKKLESNLPTTPKGKSLRNHYGVPKHYNNYGPRDILKFDHLLIKNGDGTWAGAPIPGFHGSIVTPEGNSCDITQHAYYNICSTVNDCSICAAMESCG